MADSRQFVPSFEVLLEVRADGRVVLRAPGPGTWRNAPAPGTSIQPGSELGELERLGVLHQLRTPPGARGIVVAESEQPTLARRPVEYGTELLVLDPHAVLGQVESIAVAAAATTEGLVFRSPSAGRFYLRAAPDKPPFVEVGQTIARGQTIGMLEVMKTFTRIQLDDPRLPDRVRVIEIAFADQAEVDAGAVLLRLEPG